MATQKWHEGHVTGFDTETTGINPFADRIVTAAVVHHKPAERPTTIQWLIDPDVDVPAEAAEVHGWTNDKIRAALQGHQAVRVHNGTTRPLSREAALFEITAQLGSMIGYGIPIVAANAAFDLTLLEAETRRHGIDPLTARPRGITGVVDPMVLEKQYDPYRKVKGGCKGGKHKCGGCGAEDKKLESLCRHYGVPLTAAHDAAADALAAVRLTIRLMQVWPDAARLKLGTLHEHQVGWRRTQMDGLRTYFDRMGTEHDGCCGVWPVHSPACCGDRAGVLA